MLARFQIGRAFLAVASLGGRDRCSSFIDAQVHAPIMLDAHLEGAALIEALLQEGKEITSPISHMNVLARGWRFSSLARLPGPDLRFFFLAFVSRMTGLSHRRALAQKGFLSRYSQHLSRAGINGEHRSQEIPLTLSLAHRTSSGRVGMMRVMDFSHILNQQDPLLLVHQGAGLL
jgi:hypothetical protein